MSERYTDNIRRVIEVTRTGRASLPELSDRDILLSMMKQKAWPRPFDALIL
jgi:hypothetical protein